MLFESFGTQFLAPVYRNMSSLFESKRLLHDRFPILDPSVYVTHPLDFPHRRDNLSKREKNRRACFSERPEWIRYARCNFLKRSSHDRLVEIKSFRIYTHTHTHTHARARARARARA